MRIIGQNGKEYDNLATVSPKEIEGSNRIYGWKNSESKPDMLHNAGTDAAKSKRAYDGFLDAKNSGESEFDFRKVK